MNKYNIQSYSLETSLDKVKLNFPITTSGIYCNSLTSKELKWVKNQMLEEKKHKAKYKN